MGLRIVWISLFVSGITACASSIDKTTHIPATSETFDRGINAGATSKPRVRPTALVPQQLPPVSDLVFDDKRPRYALVIGNSNYSGGGFLKNPVNDAEDIASAIKKLKFDVILRTNVNRSEMKEAVRHFGRKLKANSVGVFFYAGHAVQYEGNNYLIPLGAIDAVDTPHQLEHETVDANYVLNTMEGAGNGLNIVILDACRNNPFRGFSRGLRRGGLAQMNSATGTLIAYSTSPGNTAIDGTERNSPYTKHLLRYLATPDLSIERALKRVNAAVRGETGDKQVPWYSSSIAEEVILVRSKKR